MDTFTMPARVLWVAAVAGNSSVARGEVSLGCVSHGCEHGGREDGAEVVGDEAEDADVTFELLYTTIRKRQVDL